MSILISVFNIALVLRTFNQNFKSFLTWNITRVSSVRSESFCSWQQCEQTLTAFLEFPFLYPLFLKCNSFLYFCMSLIDAHGAIHQNFAFVLSRKTLYYNQNPWEVGERPLLSQTATTRDAKSRDVLWIAKSQFHNFLWNLLNIFVPSNTLVVAEMPRRSKNFM